MSSLFHHPATSRPSGLEAYLHQINDTPRLTAEGEKELASRISAGDPEARDRLVRANLRLVVHIARKYLGQGVSLDDLIEEGNLGLIHAAECFNPELGTRFATYATYWIEQSVRRGLDRMAKMVRIPGGVLDLVARWRRVAARLGERLGRPATEDEVAAALNLPRRKLEAVRRALQVSSAVSGALGEGSDLADFLPDDHASPPDGCTRREELDKVLTLVTRLKEREATVLRLRFGLEGGEPQTLQEVGRRLGLSHEGVRQIEKEALGKLRERFLHQ